MGFTGHLPAETRNGLIVDARLTRASGTADPEPARDMLGELLAAGDKTVGADKNYDTAAFVVAARELNVTPHVAQKIIAHRGSTIDGRTSACLPGWAASPSTSSRPTRPTPSAKTATAPPTPNRHRKL